VPNIFDPEGSGYDEETANELRKLHPFTLPKPLEYQGNYVIQPGAFEAWVWHPDINDYVKHSSSRDPRTGMLLKGRKHKTWDLLVKGETEAGYRILFKNGRYYSEPATAMAQELQKMNEAFLK